MDALPARPQCPECLYPCERTEGSATCRCPECGVEFVPVPLKSEVARAESIRLAKLLVIFVFSSVMTMSFLHHGSVVAWVGTVFFGLIVVTMAVLIPAQAIDSVRKNWPRDERGAMRNQREHIWQMYWLLTVIATFGPIVLALVQMAQVILVYQSLF